MFDHEGNQLTAAFVGDAMITRKWSICTEPRFRSVIDSIRDATVSFANLEVLLHDYEGYPSALTKGTYMRAPPTIADELQWAGFDIFSAATNHTGDFSHGGMERTMEVLEQRDIAYAGLGRNLAEARAPAYIDTPAGRVALISACSTIVPGSEAGPQRHDFHGRPGLSPLRLNTQFVLSEESHLEALREMSESLGLSALTAKKRKIESEDSTETVDAFDLFNPGGGYTGDFLKFALGDEPGVIQTFDEADKAAILKQIRAARRQADWVFMSHHMHEGKNGYFGGSSVPRALEEFAKETVDAGADAFLGHGSHVLSGIEVYAGAPIFYSLGNFVVQNETIPYAPAEFYSQYGLDHQHLPADLYDERIIGDDGKPKGGEEYWESIVARCSYEDGEINGIDIIPLDLGRNLPRPIRGRPVLATGEKRTKIFEDIKRLSNPYGTAITVKDGVGRVNI